MATLVPEKLRFECSKPFKFGKKYDSRGSPNEHRFLGLQLRAIIWRIEAHLGRHRAQLGAKEILNLTFGGIYAQVILGYAPAMRRLCTSYAQVAHPRNQGSL